MQTLLVRFLTSLLLTDFVVFLKGNLLPPCTFCGRQHGWPMVYYTEPGLVGDGQFVLNAALTDFTVSLVAAIVLTVVWSWIAQLVSKRMKQGR